jgi:hypothetical protein
MSTEKYIDDDDTGNRYWLQDDTLYAAPLLRDGTPEMENAGPVDFWALGEDESAEQARWVERQLRGDLF